MINKTIKYINSFFKNFYKKDTSNNQDVIDRILNDELKINKDLKKIISFSLWGDNPIYNIGAIRNAQIAKEIFPDWICRYYIGKSTPSETINKLKNENNTEIIIMEDDGDWTGMFWRFYPASEKDVGVMLSRDTDSRLTIREKIAVYEWLNSNKDFHIIRDHPYHNIEILGGMWGVKNHLLKDMNSLCDKFNKEDKWQTDQEFLKEIIYPLVENNSFTHDEYFNYCNEKKKIPVKRENKNFIGQAFDENDLPLHPKHMDALT